MVKLLILMIVVFSLWTIETRQYNQVRDNTAYRRTLYILHIILGIMATIFFTIHGINKLQNVSIGSCVTGTIALLLFYLELILGVLCVRRKTSFNKKVKTIHKILPVIIICVVFLHILINKII